MSRTKQQATRSQSCPIRLLQLLIMPHHRHNINQPTDLRSPPNRRPHPRQPQLRCQFKRLTVTQPPQSPTLPVYPLRLRKSHPMPVQPPAALLHHHEKTDLFPSVSLPSTNSPILKGIILRKNTLARSQILAFQLIIQMIVFLKEGKMVRQCNKAGCTRPLKRTVTTPHIMRPIHWA